jgi:hypothetical protein
MIGLPIVNGNVFGCAFQGQNDQFVWYFYDMIIFNTAAGSAKQFERLWMKYLHADLRQDFQRRLVDFVLILIRKKI